MTDGIDFTAATSINSDVTVEIIVASKTVGHEAQELRFAKHLTEFAPTVFGEQPQNR